MIDHKTDAQIKSDGRVSISLNILSLCILFAYVLTREEWLYNIFAFTTVFMNVMLLAALCLTGAILWHHYRVICDASREKDTEDSLIALYGVTQKMHKVYTTQRVQTILSRIITLTSIVILVIFGKFIVATVLSVGLTIGLFLAHAGRNFEPDPYIEKLIAEKNEKSI